MAGRSYADKAAQRLAKARRHRTRALLSPAHRTAISKKAFDTKRTISEGVALERKRQEAFVAEFAKKHHVPVDALRQRVQSASRFKTKRKVNKFNAWVHCRSLDVNEGECSLRTFCTS